MELTKQYFDKGLENLGKRLDDLVTNETLEKKLEGQTQALQIYVDQAFETQQTHIEERFQDVIELIDMRKEVERVKKDMEQVKTYLKLQGFKI